MRRAAANPPSRLADKLQVAAARLPCSRAGVVRRAVARHLEALEDREDAALTAKRLDNPNDATLEWTQVRDKYLAPDGLCSAGTARERSAADAA